VKPNNRAVKQSWIKISEKEKERIIARLSTSDYWDSAGQRLLSFDRLIKKLKSGTLCVKKKP